LTRFIFSHAILRLWSEATFGPHDIEERLRLGKALKKSIRFRAWSYRTLRLIELCLPLCGQLRFLLCGQRLLLSLLDCAENRVIGKRTSGACEQITITKRGQTGLER
jgi:hypothetical protein